MNSPIGLRQVRDVQYGTAQKQFNISDAVDFLFPYPCRAEQEAIAEALSDTDALIESLEQLLAKKRQIKKGAMQDLLTGKRRLPGFAGSERKQTDLGWIPQNWSVAKLESIIEEISMGPFGSDITVSNFVSTGVPLLNGSNVAFECLRDGFENFLTPKKAKSLKKAVARRGDVVVTHRGTIGQISYIPSNSAFDRYVVSQSQLRVRFLEDAVIPAWIVMYFHSSAGSKRLLEGKGHTGVPAIAQPTKTFRSLNVPLPSLSEQRAIFEVASDMDAELAAVEQQLAKARLIKQGMMQELLTGRIRLI
jgi:type I restriction enzyme S subunit